jgi:ribosomal protein L7/L12
MRHMDAHEWARIDRLERQVAYLLNHLEIAPDVAAGQPGAFGTAPASTFGSAADIFGAPAAAPPPGPAAGAAGPAYPPALLAALDRGKIIEAIKVYREWTGQGLREAKEAVEALARQRR